MLYHLTKEGVGVIDVVHAKGKSNTTSLDARCRRGLSGVELKDVECRAQYLLRRRRLFWRGMVRGCGGKQSARVAINCKRHDVLFLDVTDHDTGHRSILALFGKCVGGDVG